jgi:hypothetical protein
MGPDSSDSKVTAAMLVASAATPIGWPLASAIESAALGSTVFWDGEGAWLNRRERTVMLRFHLDDRVAA